MAAWISHRRIADHFLERIEGADRIDFIVGNIGPDCGEQNADRYDLDFAYLAKEEIDGYVVLACSEIESVLKEKNLPLPRRGEAACSPS
jgi:hypothetical protein